MVAYLCLSHSFIGTSDESESLNITRYDCYHRSSVTLTEGSTIVKARAKAKQELRLSKTELGTGTGTGTAPGKYKLRLY